MAVALRQPAMTEDIEMEAGRVVQVSLKSKRLFLPVPDAEKPLERDGARPQPDGHPGVIEPVGGKTETRLKKSLAQPTSVQHLAFTGTGSFNQVQRRSTLAAVVARKIEKPYRQQSNRA